MKRIEWSVFGLVLVATTYGYLAGSNASPTQGLVAFSILVVAWGMAMRQIVRGVYEERHAARRELVESLATKLTEQDRGQ